MKDQQDKVRAFMDQVADRNQGQKEFLQAVFEVAQDVIPFIEEHALYQGQKILQRLVEPDRVIMFRVCWEDDQGDIQVNRGIRVQFNNAIGP